MKKLKRLVRYLIRFLLRRQRGPSGVPEPFVYVYIQRPPSSPEHELLTHLMVDTGSFATVLSPRDVRALGILDSKPDSSILTVGGGRIKCKKVPVMLWLGAPSNEGIQSVGIEMTIYAPVGEGADWGDYSGVLGRDVLEHFVLSFKSGVQDMTLRLYLRSEG